MLLGEPPRTQADLHFRLFKIPVRVHPFFWLVAALLGANSNNLQELLAWMAAVFLAILVHELGHALAMRAYGSFPSITLYGLGGITSYEGPGSYRSVDPGPRGHILVSAAGPGAGFLLATLMLAAMRLAGYSVELQAGGPFGVRIGMELIGSPWLTDVLYQIVWISIVWGVVNLMPVYPLDGGQIAREIFLSLNPREGIQQSLRLSAITATALAVVGILQWRSLFVGLLFGYLAYTSYKTLQAYRSQGPW